MSNEERDIIDSRALLEFENAKKDMTRLRHKAGDWRRQMDSVATLLDYAQRSSVEGAKLAASARSRVEEQRSALSEILNVDAVVALAEELRAATERLARAEATKRELGFG